MMNSVLTQKPVRSYIATQSHQCMKIVDIRQENDRTRIVTLDRSLACSAGQFVMVWLPGVDEKPFSIAGNDPLTLMFVDVGTFSHALHGLQVGDRIWLRGPLGQGYTLSGQHILLAAGGYGAAPLLLLAEQAAKAGLRIDVCFGARSAVDVLLQPLFESMGARVSIATDDGSLGLHGLVTDVMEASIRREKPDTVYACGPSAMLQTVEALVQKHRIAAQFSWESHMRCGIGLCGHCELHLSGNAPAENGHASHHQPGWLTCIDGPVSFYRP